MNILKDKSYKTFDYVSRYTSTPYYYNIEDKKYIYGIGSNVSKNIDYVAHKVKESDTLDSLALKYYNNPTLFWVIGYFNDIQDCFIKLSENFEIIKIPNLNSISFGWSR